MLDAFDTSGLTALFMDPHQGGFIEGPKNLALALVAFELSWVDAGAATCSLATNLALAPIHEKGTPEQRDHYMGLCVPPQPGEDRPIYRGAFALTEPLPYVGVDTNMLVGKCAWPSGRRARNPCSRWTSAAASSPAWTSPTSSPPPWTRPIPASSPRA